MITSVGIALVAHHGCYLVGRRGPDGPLAGFHEFPGGKCQPGESPQQAAVRECFEETGLRVQATRLRHHLQHTFSYGTVRLHFFDCRLVPGSDARQLRPGFAWVPRGELRLLSFPDPNQSLLAELADTTCDAAADEG